MRTERVESPNTLVSDIMEEMNPTVLGFIKKHVTTFTRWDMIKFFHENINTHGTAADLARYIGRMPELVQREADGLVQEGILKAIPTGNHMIYAMTDDQTIRHIVADLVTTARERTFRMKLVYHILRAGGQE